MTRHSILVVDDSPTDRHFLSELLLSQGYHVTAVDNGEAALAAIKSNPPHLVIMDVVMPGQNGFQATREIKVGEVHGHHEVVVKPPGPQLASVPGLMGAAMLPDGDILLVMNLLQLHAHAVSYPSARSISATFVPELVPPLVMVVDDSLTVRRVSQRMLEKQGYGVALARHGAHALELLSQLSPAAVLLDIEMPTMDGFELLSRLRSDERFRKLPVAMITSRMAERHRQHAMQLGANAYFGKPYREQELLEWLAQCAPVKNLTTSNDRLAQNQALTSTV